MNKSLWEHILGLFAFVGESVYTCGKNILTAIIKAIGKVLSKVFGTVFRWIKSKLNQPLWDVWAWILTPFAKVWGAFEQTKLEFKKAQGFKQGIAAFGRAIWRALTGIFIFLRWSFNYIAPAVCIMFLVALIRYSGTLQYAVGVQYNGNDLGMIQNEATFNQAQALVQDKVTYTGEDESLIIKPTFSVIMTSNADDAVDSDNLSELMIGSGDVAVTEAYGFYINNELIGVYDEAEKDRIKTTLEELLGRYMSSNTANVTFTNSVVLRQGRFIESNLTSADEAIKLVTSERDVEAYYVVQKGDSVSLIASKLDITKKELLENNPFLEDGTHTGDLVTYHYTEPYLSVMTTHYETYDVDVEREVVYRYTSRMEIGEEYLYQSGNGGEENVTALVTEINGVESDRIIISRTVIEEMVPRIFVTGTKKNITIDDMSIIEDMGTFCWPVAEGGYVSSYYGYRSWDHSRHKGIDIAAKRGTYIYAAASGRVTHAGTKGTYGKLVIIDHGDDIETYYAHQYKVLVEKGDWVEKGDIIGQVGMTGSASGNHLHFELRVDNDRLDPLLCLGGSAQVDYGH